MKLDTSAAPELALLAAPPAATPSVFAAATTLPDPTTPGTAAPGVVRPGTAAPGLVGLGTAAPSTPAPGSGWPSPASLARPATAAGTSSPAEGSRPGSGAAPAGPAEGDRPCASAGPAGLASPVTVGYLAACLRFLVANPGRWWGLVRFDPQRPVHISVTAPAPGCETWLLVLPPGYQGEDPGLPPRGGVSCLIAGAVTEQAAAPRGWQDRPLSPGRTRVHGTSDPSRLINSGAGYTVTLHARPRPG